MIVTQKQRGTMLIQEILNVLWDIDIHVGTHISLVKQLGLSASALNTVVKNCHVIFKRRKYKKMFYTAYSVQKPL
jgi:hypothetical protein